MKDTKETACLCALGRIFGFEPRIGTALISHFGSAENIFSLREREIDSILGPFSKYRGQINPSAVSKAEDELAELEKKDIRFIGWSSEDYPLLLKECEDAPIGLYIRTRTPAADLWKPSEKIAVVGTRDISKYGIEWCSRTIASLACTKEKPLIVSGLALGTDICAHKAALEGGLPTIAVMATGPESVYPYRHRGIAEQIACTPGCALITDYPPGTPPLPIHFLRRNRIIAGISNAVVLIESKIKGGGMMTARLAFSYDRDVYALPGRIDDIRSQGCNLLISNKTAEPITSVDELLKNLDIHKETSHAPEKLDERLKQVYTSGGTRDLIPKLSSMLLRIRGHRGITIEELAHELKMEYLESAALARLLETDGFISIDLLQRCAIIVRKSTEI